MGELFAFIFDGIADRFQQELHTINLQYPFEPLKYLRPPLRITFNEGIDMLRVGGLFFSLNSSVLACCCYVIITII